VTHFFFGWLMMVGDGFSFFTLLCQCVHLPGGIIKLQVAAGHPSFSVVAAVQ
jgi:hypothetical protein